jgi:hypothetical protein
MHADQKLELEVATICDLERADLVALWVKTHGCPPPKGVKRGLLERSAAWHIQAQRLGGLSTHARRTIRQYAKQNEPPRRLSKTRMSEHSESAAAPEPAMRLSEELAARTSPGAIVAVMAPPPPPGTRLMREWNGRMHVVDVTEAGMLFDGKLYRSLTAVAKRITGTHWSGPRFFGL